MKHFKFILVLLTIAISIFSCKTESNSDSSIAKKPIAANAVIETASFEIDGMTCAIGCAKTIEKKLNETEGVKIATVDFDKKMGSVSYDVAIQSKEKLVKIIEAAADGTTYKVTNTRS
jgi:periplasmic mercuric ion binding protein